MADSVEVAKAYVQIVPSMEGAQSAITKGLTGASSTAGKRGGAAFGNKFTASTKKAMKAGAIAIAAAGAAAAKGTVDLVKSTADYGDTVDKASQKLGISSKAFQEWDAVLRHSGTSMGAMTPAFKKLATQAQGDSDKTVAAFKKIGLSMKEAQSMSTEELWAATISGLQKMENGTERTAVASQLLGRGATELGAVFNMSAKDTQRMINTVNKLGGVMDEKGVKNSAKFKDTLQDAETAVSAIGRSIGVALLPKITKLMEGFMAIATGDTEKGLRKIRNAFASLLPKNLRKTFKDITDTVAEKLTPAFESLKSTFDTVSDEFNTFIDESGPDLTELFSEMSEAVSTSMEAISAVVSTVMPLIRKVIQIEVKRISSVFKLFNMTADNVRKRFNLIKEFITNPIETAKRIVKGAVDAIKGFFNFTAPTPRIPLPHFSINPAGWKLDDLLKGSIPSLGISWYAKGGIFDGPSVIGVGERGPEAVVPLSSDRMRPFAEALQAAGAGGDVYNINLSYNAGATAADMVNDLFREIKRVKRRG